MSFPFPPIRGSASPWGPIQHVTPLGPDAASVSTASHGGIVVAPAGLIRVPKPLRGTSFSAAGWFEEDCDWAIPYLALGLHAFEPGRGDAARRTARRAIWRWHRPHAGLLGIDQDPDVEASPGGRPATGEEEGRSGGEAG